MNNNWEKKKLGEILDVLRNGINCKQNKKGIGDKISRIESISNAEFDIEKVGFAELSKSEKNKYCLSKGDILFSHINSPIHVGKTAIFDSDEEVYHGVNLLLMRPKSFLDVSYFEYYLKFLFQNGYWKRLCKQSVNQASVNQQDINKVEISYPNALTEQKHIVKILDEAFAAIEKAKANAEKNLQNSRELFDSYLNNVFANTGEEWEEKKLGEVCNIINGGTPKTDSKEYWDGNVKWITPKDMGKLTCKFVDDTPRKITYLGLQKSSAKLIPSNSLILSTRAPIGHLAINISEMATNQGCRGIVPLSDINAQYLYYFLSNSIDLLNSLGTGATFRELSTKALSFVNIPVPPIDKQKRIIQSLNNLSNQTKKLEKVYQQKLVDLEELKKSILQKAFDGQL